jgi:hypothetical protein
MTKKTTRPTTTNDTPKKTRSVKTPVTDRRDEPADIHEGAPIEKFRGERTQLPLHTGDPGALEEETLDSDAPYNRTYGNQ